MESSQYSDQVNSMLSSELSGNYILKDDITLIVPTLNEEKAIELVLKNAILEGYRNLMVVDGNSVDRTIDIVKGMKVDLHIQTGKGKTGAIKTALNHVKTPYFVVIDGDHTYSIKDIESLIEMAPFYNQVIGARRDKNNIKAFNRLGNKLINILFNFSFGTKLTDVCSGLYLLNTSFAKKISLDTSGFDVEVEIAAQVAKSKKIAECPISYSTRIGIQKLNPIRDGFKIISSIIKLCQKYNPLLFYSSLTGIILTSLGLGLLILDIFSKNYASFHLMGNFNTLLIGAGVQFLVLSIILSQLKIISN